MITNISNDETSNDFVLSRLLKNYNNIISFIDQKILLRGEFIDITYTQFLLHLVLSLGHKIAKLEFWQDNNEPIHQI